MRTKRWEKCKEKSRHTKEAEQMSQEQACEANTCEPFPTEVPIVSDI